MLFVAWTAWGQNIPTSSPNIVGSGARALGMGSAFIAVADDATAASWNPGGLTQLERPEFSLVLSVKRFEERAKKTQFIDPEGDFHVTLEDINYMSFVYPLRHTIRGRNIVFSLNYQQQLDFARTLKLKRSATLLGGSRIFRSIADTEHTQTGSLSTLSPAFAIELTDRVSVGMAINLWDSDFVPGNGWKTHTRTKTRTGPFGALPSFSLVKNADTYDNFHGRNYTFGILARPREGLSIGLVYHTKFVADVNFKRVRNVLFPVPFASTRKSSVRFQFPSAVGLGIAYRFPNDKLTLSFDVTRREWDQYVKIDRQGGIFGAAGFKRRVSPITEISKSRSAHDATYTIRLGAEYVFVDTTKPRQKFLPSIRGGIFYDPEPASGRKDTLFGVSHGDGDPDDFYGVALGAGVQIANRVNLDFAYQFRWGTNVRKDLLTPFRPSDKGFSMDVYQHQFFASTVVYF